MKKIFALLLLALSSLLASGAAQAYTDCQITVFNVSAATNNTFFVNLSPPAPAGSPSFYITVNGQAEKNMLSVIETAKVIGAQIIVRFTANSVNCGAAAARTDAELVTLL